jgi:hypothetical protein
MAICGHGVWLMAELAGVNSNAPTSKPWWRQLVNDLRLAVVKAAMIAHPSENVSGRKSLASSYWNLSANRTLDLQQGKAQRRRSRRLATTACGIRESL